MCCGRGVKNAASRQYASPKALAKVKLKQPVKATPAAPQKGAYYGNPYPRPAKVSRRSALKKSPVDPAPLAPGKEETK